MPFFLGGALKITGGCKITAEGKNTGINVGGSSCVVNGNTTVNAYGNEQGMYLSGNVVFEACAVNTNSVYISNNVINNIEDSIENRVTIGSGSVFDIKPQQLTWTSAYVTIAGDSKLLLDGGTVHIEDEDSESMSMMVYMENGDIQIDSGTIELISSGKSGFHLGPHNQHSYVQNGGEVKINTKGYGFYVPNQGGRFTQKGGSIDVENGENDIEGDVVISGGRFTSNGRNCGIGINGGNVTIFGGEIFLAGDTAINMGDGMIRFLGGVTTLESKDLNRYAFESWGYRSDNKVTLGKGMYAVSDNGEILELTDLPDNGWGYHAQKAVISGNGGKYTSDMYITDGQVIAGAFFTVKAAYALGVSEGTVQYTLPEGMKYIDKSLTINGDAANNVIYDNEANTLKIDVHNADIVRFNAYALESGNYRIKADISTGKTVHEEKLDVSVSDFTLNLPAQTKRKELPISGTAVPGSKITLFDNERKAGEVTANSLGGWKAVLKLQSEETVHKIHAEILYENKITYSKEYDLLYDSDMAEVETLTVINYVHGSKENEVLEYKVVLNYMEGTKDANYIIYWPALPEFTFRVYFTDESEVASVEQVQVVTTDKNGKEIIVPLVKADGENFFTGTYIFDDQETLVPQNYQVRWIMKDKELDYLQTQPMSVPAIVDPSGYVYEGVANNRLSGVTATVYYSEKEPEKEYKADENQIWNAEDFDQLNPQQTDVLGQYMWMVPAGWWQVKYEKEGYETYYSEWLPVPPVQTEVNIGLITKEQAKIEASMAEDGTIAITFNHPVLTSTVNQKNITVTCNGRVVEGVLYALDSDWTEDGRVCATSFKFVSSPDSELFVAGAEIQIEAADIYTYADIKSHDIVSFIIPLETEPEDPKPEQPGENQGSSENNGNTGNNTGGNISGITGGNNGNSSSMDSDQNKDFISDDTPGTEDVAHKDPNIQPDITDQNGQNNNIQDTDQNDQNNNVQDVDNSKITKEGEQFKKNKITYKIISGRQISIVKVGNSVIKKGCLTIGNTVIYDGLTYKITSIGKNVLKNNKKLKKVIIGKNIKSIEKMAFYGCKLLRQVNIKSTKLTKVGKKAFKGIHSKAKIMVPVKKYKSYKKLLKGKGLGKNTKMVRS